MIYIPLRGPPVKYFAEHEVTRHAICSRLFFSGFKSAGDARPKEDAGASRRGWELREQSRFDASATMAIPKYRCLTPVFLSCRKSIAHHYCEGAVPTIRS